MGPFIHLVSEEIFFFWKIIGFRNHENLSVDKVKNNSSEFRVNKTYFCRDR